MAFLQFLLTVFLQTAHVQAARRPGSNSAVSYGQRVGLVAQNRVGTVSDRQRTVCRLREANAVGGPGSTDNASFFQRTLQSTVVF